MAYSIGLWPTALAYAMACSPQHDGPMAYRMGPTAQAHSHGPPYGLAWRPNHRRHSPPHRAWAYGLQHRAYSMRLLAYSMGILAYSMGLLAYSMGLLAYSMEHGACLLAYSMRPTVHLQCPEDVKDFLLVANHLA